MLYSLRIRYNKIIKPKKICFIMPRPNEKTPSYEQKSILDGPLLLMPTNSKSEDYQVKRFIDSPKFSELEIKTILCVGDIDFARFYPYGILGLELEGFERIKNYLERSPKE